MRKCAETAFFMLMGFVGMKNFSHFTEFKICVLWLIGVLDLLYRVMLLVYELNIVCSFALYMCVIKYAQILLPLPFCCIDTMSSHWIHITFSHILHVREQIAVQFYKRISYFSMQQIRLGRFQMENRPWFKTKKSYVIVNLERQMQILSYNSMS